MNTVKPESIALFCLTPGGVQLAKRLAAMLPLTCFTSEKLLEDGFMPFKADLHNRPAIAFANYPAPDFYRCDRHSGTHAGTAGKSRKSATRPVVVIDERASM